MANRVTNEDIIKINESYYKNKTYAAAARDTGFSAGTVKKYVIPGWEPTKPENFIKITLDDIPELNTLPFSGVDNYGDLCVLTVQERKEMKELWKELTV